MEKHKHCIAIYLVWMCCYRSNLYKFAFIWVVLCACLCVCVYMNVVFSKKYRKASCIIWKLLSFVIQNGAYTLIQCVVLIWCHCVLYTNELEWTNFIAMNIQHTKRHCENGTCLLPVLCRQFRLNAVSNVFRCNTQYTNKVLMLSSKFIDFGRC